MTEQLLERINTIDRFAADVAHEFEKSADLAAQRRAIA